MTCGFCMFVSDASGAHEVAAYLIPGLMTALQVTKMLSYCLLHVVKLNSLMICRDLCALVAVFCI